MYLNRTRAMLYPIELMILLVAIYSLEAAIDDFEQDMGSENLGKGKTEHINVSHTYFVSFYLYVISPSSKTFI